MSLKIALIISVLLQFITAILALSLIKRTKTNIAWWLITLGLLLMAVRRLFELIHVFNPENDITGSLVNSWLGIIISVLMLMSLSFIKRIFNIQKRYDELKEKNESIVFSAIINTEENLKQRFSRELHDGLGPLLSSIKMSISAIAKNPGSDNNHMLLTNTEVLIDESIRTVKEISNNLSPHVLVNFGLDKALKSFIERLHPGEGPEIVLNTNIENQRFSNNTETVIYRIICELINNSLKHAEARHIYIDLIRENEEMQIKFMDDGKGFEFVDDASLRSGLGITDIQSRIKSLQGSYEISTQPGEGFNISIHIKLN